MVAAKSGAVSLGMIVVAPGLNLKERIAHVGAWGVTAIMIVVGSWALCRFLAPKTLREWVQWKQPVEGSNVAAAKMSNRLGDHEIRSRKDLA